MDHFNLLAGVQPLGREMEGRADQMSSFCFFFGGEGRKDARDRVQSKAEFRVEYPLQDGPPAVMSRDMTPRIGVK